MGVLRATKKPTHRALEGHPRLAMTSALLTSWYHDYGRDKASTRWGGEGGVGGERDLALKVLHKLSVALI